MKKCSRCSKPATLHITEIRDGLPEVLHLCEVCSQDFLNNPNGSEMASEATSFADKLAEFTSDEQLDQLDQLSCPNCGVTFQEFRSQGRLGCPHDYIAFGRELMPLLENIHEETQHAGKFPKRAPDASQRQYRLIKLRNDLRLAVEEENYETAANLRDEIKVLDIELGEEESEPG